MLKHTPSLLLLALLLATGACDDSSPSAVDAGFRYVADGLTVSFTNTSSADSRAFDWDFGDGAGSNERDPVHIYRADDRYIVTLRACPDGNFLGEKCDTESQTIEVAAGKLSEGEAGGSFWDYNPVGP